MKFENLVENQTNLKIKTMVNYNGGEYVSNAFETFTSEHGIRMNPTAPYTPKQDPVAEIGNRTTVEKARALLKTAYLPHEFWAEAVTTAVYLENITPVALRNYQSPHEIWFGKKPTYEHLQVFGCLAYVHHQKELWSGKFSDKAKRGILLGYQDGHHNYRIWLLEDKRVAYSHDVVFNETIFPFKNPSNPSLPLDPSGYDFLDQNDSFIETTTNQTQLETTEDTDQGTHSDSSYQFSGSDLIPAQENPSSEIADIPIPERIVEGDLNPSLPIMGTKVAPDCQPSSKSKSHLSHDHDSRSSNAPKNISSKIEPVNILPKRTRRQAQATRVTTTTESHQADALSYHQALSRANSDEWVVAIL